MAVFLGANGSGKSTLFDAFGFLHDALIDNVRAAITKRGGYKEVVSRGERGPIEFEIKFRPKPGDPKVTYMLRIGLDKKGIPIVKREVLKYRRGQKGKPWHFLDFSEGTGVAIVNESEYGQPDAKPEREEQSLDSPDILAIKGLGQFQKFPQIAAFRRLIEGWHVSDFHRDTYPLHKNNCGANGGNHRGARALRVTFSTKEPSLCALMPPKAAPKE